MKVTPLLEGHYYHIYNRGNNGCDLFFEKRNYHYFSVFISDIFFLWRKLMPIA